MSLGFNVLNNSLNRTFQGYEILTKREQLADRPIIERLSPLSHEEYKTFVEGDGRISQVKALCERIFRGVRFILLCMIFDPCVGYNSYKMLD